MLSRIRGTVESIDVERPGIQEIKVRVGEELRAAINYPLMTGTVAAGDSVVLNTWAVSLGLGTGGTDFVTTREPAEAKKQDEPPGHVMKLRYTPMQLPVLAAEAQESEHHRAMRRFDSLNGLPVVCAELHSQLPAIAAAIKWETKGRARVVYVMSDAAALPIALSRSVAQLKEAGIIDATVTSGQAFGGDYEAVNLYSALAVARIAARADVIVVAQGPGSVGTGTTLGFSGVDQGMALNAAVSLGGTAIAVLRMSDSDPRERHRGISHHTLTVLETIVLSSVLVPIPRLPAELYRDWRQALEDPDLRERHEFITVDADPGLAAIEEGGIALGTMGRSGAEDRLFFLAAAAAGLLAGQWASGSVRAPRRKE